MDTQCVFTRGTDQRRSALADEMQRTFGSVVGGFTLAKLLGMPSADALRQARKRGKLPVRLFKLENRRPWFALTEDVAVWLASLRQQTPTPYNPEKGAHTQP